MKKLISIVLALTVLFAFAACGNTAGTETTAPEATEEATEEPTAALDMDAYNAALAALYTQETADVDKSIFTPKVFYADLNFDGYKDVIAIPNWFPKVMVYSDGEFVEAKINAEECTFGSNFPVADGAGYFLCADDGLIIVRDSGHNEGSKDTMRAVAYELNGPSATLLWQIDSDPEAADTVADFNAKYEEKTADHNLINVYEEAEIWAPAE